MYGAIYGDIIGSKFEFDRGPWRKEFELFTDKDNFTDDTVMTIAVGQALVQAGKDASIDKIRQFVEASMVEWGHKYPNAGYGGRFYNWLFSGKKLRPYNSLGNGSAMRVSAVGWLYDSLERTREVARATAEVTHNHPEGMKGAECTATVMFLSRTGVGKDEIKEFVTKEFRYDISHTCDELRPFHRMDETCMDALPKALISFFEGNSYEDVIRNAVSLGGDTDTIAAIAGAMAEAFYGIPVTIAAYGNGYIPEDMKAILKEFDIALGRIEPDEVMPNYENNEYIKYAVAEIRKNETDDNILQLLAVLAKRMLEDGEVLAPMVDVNHALIPENIDDLKIGGTFSLEKEARLRFDTMVDSEGVEWLPLFTDEDELNKGNTANIRMNVSIESILRSGIYSNRAAGVVINPFGDAITLNKNIMKLIFEMNNWTLED